MSTQAATQTRESLAASALRPGPNDVAFEVRAASRPPRLGLDHVFVVPRPQ